jgi:pseudouridine kinase
MRVTVIGAANMDVNGFSVHPILWNDSNVARVDFCPGGVGRNIAENLARLGSGRGVDVSLITVIGDDLAGDMLRTHSAKLGIDLSDAMNIHGPTAVYLAVMDSDGVMKVALCDQSAPRKMTVEHLKAHFALLSSSDIIVLDSSLNPEAQEYLVDSFPDTPVFLDPIAVDLAARSKGILGKLHTLKANRMEACALAGLEIPAAGAGKSRKAVEVAADALLETGLERAFISLGKDGSYCKRRDSPGIWCPAKGGKLVNTSGGGDAFMAGCVWGSLQGWDDGQTIRFASAMAGITVQSETTVSEDMSVDLVEEFL